MMAIPRPGKPSTKTRSGRPVMVLLDLIGRRWALRVLWELRSEPLNFRALREACEDVSPSVLNTRLKELRSLGLVSHEGDGYALTPQARELVELLLPLTGWSERWAASLDVSEKEEH